MMMLHVTAFSRPLYAKRISFFAGKMLRVFVYISGRGRDIRADPGFEHRAGCVYSIENHEPHRYSCICEFHKLCRA